MNAVFLSKTKVVQQYYNTLHFNFCCLYQCKYCLEDHLWNNL